MAYVPDLAIACEPLSVPPELSFFHCGWTTPDIFIYNEMKSMNSIVLHKMDVKHDGTGSGVGEPQWIPTLLG